MWVEKCLFDLVPLDCPVENSSSSKFSTADKNSFVLETESVGGDDVVWEKPEYQTAPEHSDCTANEENQFPYRKRVNLADAVGENAPNHRANTIAAIKDSSSEWLFLSCVPLERVSDLYRRAVKRNVPCQQSS